MTRFGRAVPLRNERSAHLLSSSDGHLGAADDGLGLRGRQAGGVVANPPSFGLDRCA